MSNITRPSDNFTRVPNEPIKDKRISLKAKGLYAYIMSKPDDWNFSFDRIANDVKDGRDSTLSAIHELEEFGYLVRSKLKTGRTQYALLREPTTENPNKAQKEDNPTTEKPYEGKSQVGKIHTISNTENTNNTVFISNTVSISKDIGENPQEGVREISLDDIYAGSEDLKRGEIQKTTALAETTIHPTPPTPSPRAKGPSPNVEAILSAIKQYHGGVDGSPAEERKYAHNLAKKIIAHPTFSEFLFRSENESEAIRLFVLAVCQRANSYQTGWTTSPKSLYYNLLKITNSKPKNSIGRA